MRLASHEKQISAKKDSPQDLSFGWQRSRLLGAFFNGVFLLALGVSIFLQSIERFVSVQGVWCICRLHVISLIKSQSWNSQSLCSSLVASAWRSILSAPRSCMVRPQGSYLLFQSTKIRNSQDHGHSHDHSHGDDAGSSSFTQRSGNAESGTEQVS